LSNEQTPEENKALAKTTYQVVLLELMPEGKPNYLEVVKYPKISDLLPVHGAANMLFMLAVMVRDFCASLNVVRNMNEDQIIETATMMLQECGNYRLEDYAQFFTQAKRGQLGMIRDRVDLQVIMELLDQYHKRRSQAAEDKRAAEIEREENQIVIPAPFSTPEQRKASKDPDDRVMGLGGALSNMKAAYLDKFPDLKKLEGNG